MANEATKILHGETAAKKAEKTSQKTFEIGGIGTDLPEIKIEKNILKKWNKTFRFIVNKKYFSSKSEARRAIKGNALKINNKVLFDENKILDLNDFADELTIKISLEKEALYN